MDSDVIIRADRLGKKYMIGHESERERYIVLRDVIGRSVRNFVRTTVDMLHGRPIFAGDTIEEFWALKDVDFEIKRGEVVGIIGRNGAGKSTLLKILSRITEPTEGRVTINGRVASLLEVGTGFHGELTGRENIYLNGAILGMRRAEIRRKFDEIVAFAEIEKFLDTPVKRYSSGMYVRLAFAVAAHLEPEILLVDEVLAVGDAEFQRKSLGKMSDVAKGGRTVLFVSHNLGAVRRLCSHAFLLENGELAFGGNVDEALMAYERLFRSSGRLVASASFSGPLADQVRFDQFICRQGGTIVSVLNPLLKFEIELRGLALRAFSGFELMIYIFRDGLHIASCYDTDDQAPLGTGHFISRFNIHEDIFRPGMYTIAIGCFDSTGLWAWCPDVAALEFSENLGGRPAHRSSGVVGIAYTAQRIEQNIMSEVPVKGEEYWQQSKAESKNLMDSSAGRALRSPRVRAFVTDCLPPILIRLFRRIQKRPEHSERPELIWSKNRYDGYFEIDWSKTNFNRIAVINLLCAGQRCENYLEIGCNVNECFDSVIARNKMGVDPERGGTHRLTSDQFFAECGDEKFDIIFIDGQHTYEQVRRDVINALRHISIGGWIVLHDMFPRNWLEEHVPWIISPVWVGDVWKVGFELARSPGIDFKILKIDYGVGILRITKDNPSIPDLRTELQAERFRYFYENIHLLPILDYEQGRAWIEHGLRKQSRTVLEGRPA